VFTSYSNSIVNYYNQFGYCIFGATNTSNVSLYGNVCNYVVACNLTTTNAKPQNINALLYSSWYVYDTSVTPNVCGVIILN